MDHVKSIDTANGRGMLSREGGPIVVVYYSLSVDREYEDDVPGDWIIQAQVMPYVEDHETRLAMEQTAGIAGGEEARITLTLRDGRRWESIPPDPEPRWNTYHLETRSPHGLTAAPEGWNASSFDKLLPEGMRHIGRVLMPRKIEPGAGVKPWSTEKEGKE